MEKDWFEQALDNFHEDNYSQALFAITKYTAAKPEDKNGKLLKAIISREMSNYPLAFSIFNEIVPGDADTEDYRKSYYTDLADTYKEMGNYQEAATWYDKLIALSPNESHGYILKGACLAAAGQYELAKPALFKAIESEGDREEAYYNLALIARAEMNFAEAKEYCEKSLAIFPADERVIQCLGDLNKAIKLAEQNAG